MQGGSKRYITSQEVFIACGYLWGNVNSIPDSTLSTSPSGASLTGAPCP